MYTKHKEYAELSCNEKREFLATTALRVGRGAGQSERWQKEHEKPKLSTGPPCFERVCRRCWADYNGVKLPALEKIEREVSSGRKNFEMRGRRRTNAPDRKKEAQYQAFFWLQNYARTRGDHMPDCLQIHLPNYKWTDVWRVYKKEACADGPAISLASFAAMRKRDLPYIKVRKVKRFAKCKICSDLTEAMGKATGAALQLLRSKHDEHVEWQYREREKYYKHRFKSRMFPGRSMTMSVDGMDNGKTSIPRTHRDDKDTDKGEKLGVHLTGVLLHGRKNPIRAYTWYDRFPTGSDSIATIICHALKETATDAPLPPVLYLHLDNCSRENKNRYLRHCFLFCTLGM